MGQPATKEETGFISELPAQFTEAEQPFTVKVEESDSVLVTKAEYDTLKTKAEKLDALEAFGVDNWGAYGTAMDSLKK